MDRPLSGKMSWRSSSKWMMSVELNVCIYSLKGYNLTFSLFTLYKKDSTYVLTSSHSTNIGADKITTLEAKLVAVEDTKRTISRSPWAATCSLESPFHFLYAYFSIIWFLLQCFFQFSKLTTSNGAVLRVRLRSPPHIQNIDNFMAESDSEGTAQ